MKTIFLLVFCLSLTGCKKNASSDLIVFDVNGKFPEKILNIQDVADVDYLVLDITDDDYLFSDYYSMTENFIICLGDRDKREFLFFCRKTGKPVSKISRRGQGPEEYSSPVIYVYSEPKDEFFLVDHPSIKVYGRDGMFKRRLHYDGDLYQSGVNSLLDYDEDHLLFNCFSFRGNMKDSSFVLLSKQNGSIIDKICIPYEKRINFFIIRDGAGIIADSYPAVRNGNDFLLTEYSSDTVFCFTPERELIPVLVRTPPVQGMNPKILLHSWLETSKYLFFSTQKLDFDWNTLKMEPHTGYLMEKNSGTFFQTKVQLPDYQGKELVISPKVIERISSQQTGIIVLSALELHDAKKANKLSGKLKEVSNRLTEDDEFVFMILSFK
jgi:hypothetical protein